MLRRHAVLPILASFVAIAAAAEGGTIGRDRIPPGPLADSLDKLAPAALQKALKTLHDLGTVERDAASLRASPDGGIYYVCFYPAPPAGAQPAPPTAEQPSWSPRAPVSIDSPPAYSSKPGAPNTIYLDFNGEKISGTGWNTSSGIAEWDCGPFDIDSNPTTFSDEEQRIITYVYQRTAEHYLPFNVNVTTVAPTAFTSTTGRILYTPDIDKKNQFTPTYNDVARDGGAILGIAFVDVFGDPGYPTVYSPAWVSTAADKFQLLAAAATREQIMSQSGAHEMGHNMGLRHDGRDTSEYYVGHGSGAVSWSPIMGNGFQRAVQQWSKGEYIGATRTEDDLLVIGQKTGNQTDDRGNSQATASALAIGGNGAIQVGNAANRGIIGVNSDEDWYRFSCGAGTINISVQPLTINSVVVGNLDVVVDLWDSEGNRLTTFNPTDRLGVTFAYGVGLGTYYLRIRGVGTGNPYNNPPSGYTAYGSLGQYVITGDVPPLYGTLGFTTNRFTARETASFLDLKVARSNGSTGAVSVDYATSAGSATVADLVLGSGKLTWTDGELGEKTISLAIFDDLIPEGDHSATVTLSNPTGGASLGLSSARATIDDDELNDDNIVPPPGNSSTSNGASGIGGKDCGLGAGAVGLIGLGAFILRRRRR